MGHRHVLMLGPSPRAQGGMATVVETYERAGLFENGDCRYLDTTRDGPTVLKLATGALALARMLAQILRARVSVVHVHSASARSFWRKRVFIELARAAGVPVVFHLHGGEFRQWLGRLPAARQSQVLRTLGKVQHLVCLHTQTQQWLSSAVPHVTVEVVPNPLLLAEYPWADPESRSNGFLFLGRLEVAKGLHELVEAFACVRTSRPDTRLVLAGEGSAEADLRRQVQALQLDAHVDFAGWVDGERKHALLRESAVMVLPSYVEGMPLGVLEAMATGLPVVATRVAAVPTLLGEGCGFLVDVKDVKGLAEAMLLALDPAHGPPAAVRARARVSSHYSASVVLARLRQIHAELS